MGTLLMKLVWFTWWIAFYIRYSRIFWVYLKKNMKKRLEKNLVKRLIILQKINVNKIGKRITFKIKTEYYLELLTTEEMKLLRGTKSKINEIKMVKTCLI